MVHNVHIHAARVAALLFSELLTVFAFKEIGRESAPNIPSHHTDATHNMTTMVAAGMLWQKAGNAGVVFPFRFPRGHAINRKSSQEQHNMARRGRECSTLNQKNSA